MVSKANCWTDACFCKWSEDQKIKSSFLFVTNKSFIANYIVCNVIIVYVNICESDRQKTFKSPLRESMNGLHHVNQNYSYTQPHIAYVSLLFILFTICPIIIIRKITKVFYIFSWNNITQNCCTDDGLIASFRQDDQIMLLPT